MPYLGHPYNQLGILFETTRTNQLATVFYYMRSIAVRYAFPLASTNLEVLFNKLIDVPLSRYMPSITSGGENKSVAIRLPHMDLIALFVQINAMIYFAGKRTVRNHLESIVSTPTVFLPISKEFERGEVTPTVRSLQKLVCRVYSNPRSKGTPRRASIHPNDRHRSFSFYQRDVSSYRARDSSIHSRAAGLHVGGQP